MQLCSAWVYASPALQQAQVLYGTLIGTVQDTSGATIAGAQITAAEVGTGITQTATSDSAGIYRFTTLLPGTYISHHHCEWFLQTGNPGRNCDRDTAARVNGELKVGTAAPGHQSLPPRLRYSKPTRPMSIPNMTSQQVDNLPTMGSQGRNFQALLKTVPGTGLTAETNSLAGNPQRSINVNINGQSNQGNNTRIDGAQDSYPGCLPTSPMSRPRMPLRMSMS